MTPSEDCCIFSSGSFNFFCLSKFLNGFLPHKSLCLSPAKITSAAACHSTQSGRIKSIVFGARIRDGSAGNTDMKKREKWYLEIRCRAAICAMMLFAVCEGLLSSTELCYCSYSAVQVQASVLRDPAVGMSAESCWVLFIPVNCFLVALFGH